MPRAIGVVSDLIFASKIRATAQAVGVDAEVVPASAALAKALSEGDVRLVMVDMSLGGDEAPAALRCSAGHTPKPSTIAFYAHVQTELRDAAAQAGADAIMPRSQFSAELPSLLERHCARGG